MHFSFGFATFLWKDEIISTMKTRYFQVKCNLFWHNWEIFLDKLKNVKQCCQKVRKTENYISVKNCLEQLGTHVGDINMHLQQKALIEECSVNKVVLQKSVIHCTAIFL